ncbi:MAG: SAM-dependent MidA family methyltransferase, partial [Yoonia sp.]
MTALGDLMLARIAATGPITLADYMADCLMHPVLGYYTTRDPLGVTGDFTTAPEISQMFGELIGLSLAQAWLDQGSPPQITLAELGPGRGTLMADALRATRGVAGFHAALIVHFVETSPS